MLLGTQHGSRSAVRHATATASTASCFDVVVTGTLACVKLPVPYSTTSWAPEPASSTKLPCSSEIATCDPTVTVMPGARSPSCVITPRTTPVPGTTDAL